MKYLPKNLDSLIYNSNNSNLPHLKSNAFNSSNNISMFNNDNNKIKKRYFLASKEELEDSIYNNLKDRFENSENYFKEIPGVIIGRIPKGPIEDKKTHSYIMHTIVGGEELAKDLKRSKNKGVKPRQSVVKDLTSSKKIDSLKSNYMNTITFIQMQTCKKDTLHKNGSLNNSIGNSNQISANKGIFEVTDNNKISELENKFKLLIENNKRIAKCERLPNQFITEIRELTYNNNNENSFSNSNYNSPVSIRKGHQQSNNYLFPILPSLNQSNNYLTTLESLDDNKGHDSLKRNNKTKNNKDEVLFSIPENIKSEIRSQEKTIDLFEKNERIQKKLEEHLCNKTKRLTNNLLLNSGERYLFKHELNNIIDSKVPYEEKMGNLNWIMSLRKPKNFKGSREVYVNLGSNINPHWQMVKETKPINYEKKGNPETFKNEKQSLFETIDNDDIKREISAIDNNVVSL